MQARIAPSQATQGATIDGIHHCMRIRFQKPILHSDTAKVGTTKTMSNLVNGNGGEVK
jgi:hypothetical protein